MTRDSYADDTGVLQVILPSGDCVACMDGVTLSTGLAVIPMTNRMRKVRLVVSSKSKVHFDRTVIVHRGAKVTVTIPAATNKSQLSKYPLLSAYLKSMRVIPGGSFNIGCNTRQVNERPRHLVKLDSFRIGSHPVTEEMFDEYLHYREEETPVHVKDYSSSAAISGEKKSPAYGYSVQDMVGLSGIDGYCGWASKVAGIVLELPTESQWEVAASGGINGRIYPWGNKFDRKKVHTVLGNVPNYPQVTRTKQNYRNRYGLSDIVGTIRIACSDFYGPYEGKPQNNPGGPRNGDSWVTRGVGVDDDPWGDKSPKPENCTVTRRCCDVGEIGFVLCINQRDASGRGRQ